MNARRKIFVMALAAILLLSMAGMASAVSQTWYFTDDPGYTHKVMYKGSGVGSANVLVDSYGNPRYWNSDETVAVALIDMHGQWHVNIDYIVPSAQESATSTIKVEIGLWDTAWRSKGFLEATATGGGSRYRNFKGNIAIDSFDMSSGDYLVLRVNNKEDYNIYVNTTAGEGNSPSYISSPATDPGFPVPELSSLLLTSLGVLMLGGFVVYSRRRNNK